LQITFPIAAPAATGLEPISSAPLGKRVLSQLAGEIMRLIPARWELGHRATHGVLTRQAMAILAADGHTPAASWLQKHERALIRGLYWADEGWKCVTHFYHPVSGQGYLAWPSAVQTTTEYVKLARLWYTLRVMPAAAFYLGAAVHLVQDLCVPHHASATIRQGHKAYEAEGEHQVSRYLVRGGGLYTPWSPADWVHANAAEAEQWMHEPAGTESGLGAMLERSQRTTAGFLNGFLSAMAAGTHYVDQP
jgi:phospholipase C